MIAFVLANWKWLLGALTAAALGAYVGVQRVEIATLKEAAAKTALALEKQKTEAANALADATAQVLMKERQNAALNATLEKERTDGTARDAATAAALGATMASWVRAHPGCRASGRSTAGPGASPAGVADTTAVGTEVLPSGSGGFIQRCSAAGDELAAYARECHAFVTTLENHP